MSKCVGVNSTNSLKIEKKLKLFHLTNRTEDHSFFLIPLKELWEVFMGELRARSFRLHVFVLMGNHFHILCESFEEDLPEQMRNLLVSISKKTGIRWEEGFRSSLIENYTHYIEVYRYILQNPMRAGIVTDIWKYPYSTFYDHRLTNYSNISMVFAGEAGERLWLNNTLDPELEKLIQLGLRKRIFHIAERKLGLFERLTTPKTPSDL